MLEDYFKRKLRLVIFLGKERFNLSLPVNSIHRFIKPEDLTREKLAYLRADLIILDKFQTGLNMDELLHLLENYSHEEGAIFFLKENKELEKMIINYNFDKVSIPHLYIKKKGSTPKEYNIDYLKRWGNTDFLKNWKLAGKEILFHIPSGLSKSSVRILDIGCLNGYIMETLRMNGVKNVYGCDISYEIAVNNCINKYHLPAITIGDFCDNHYPDKFSDLTIAMEILEHIPPDKTDKFISELKRVTADNGKILISTSEDMNVDPTHVNCRTRSEWYYEFGNHGIVPTGKQLIFPGFNSFVFKKAANKWKTFIWKTLFVLMKTFSLSKINEFIFLLKHFIIKKLLDEKIAKITYSQCGEDLIIKHIFDSLRILRPSYLDIGAYHPFSLNNTALFYLNGSRGINIEPNVKNFKPFLNYRKRDVNLNVGIAEKPGFLNYYEMNVPTLNTFSKKEADNYVKEGYKIQKISKIKAKTIENILMKYWHGQFPDLLSIDVEGSELEILNSLNFNKHIPIVICVETISFSISGQGKKNSELIKFVEKQGYLLYADTNINTIFVKKDIWMNR